MDVHHVFHSLLLANRPIFVYRLVHDLTVEALELAKVVKVDFNVAVFLKELTDSLEYVQKGLVIHALLHVSSFGHDTPIWFYKRVHNDVRILVNINHLAMPLKAVCLHKRLI
jgi:hypothetical protein